MKEKLSTATCVRLKEQTLKEIEKLAQQKQRSVSQLMRLVLENYVEQSTKW